MADIISSAQAGARNPHATFEFIPSRSEPAHPGLVKHELVSPGVQVQILSVVDATGSAPLADIITALPSHPDAVGAVFAMIDAGVLDIAATGLIDASTIVARRDRSVEPDDGSANEPATDPAGLGVDDQSTPFAMIAPDQLQSLPADFAALAVADHKPLILCAAGARKLEFGRIDAIRRPGIYVMIRGGEAYVGMGADVGARITQGRQMPDDAADAIIAIVDDHDNCTIDDMRCLERMLWGRVAREKDLRLINGVPHGHRIGAERYDELSVFMAQTAISLRHAGFLFCDAPARQVIAGPRSEPGRLGSLRPLDEPPIGELMELQHGGMIALAAACDDGTWLLLRGSEIRRDTVPSASASSSYQRAAWEHAGLLAPASDGSCYVARRDIVFSSASAAGHFVTGSRAGGLAAWKPADPDGPHDSNGPALTH